MNEHLLPGDASPDEPADRAPERELPFDDDTASADSADDELEGGFGAGLSGGGDSAPAPKSKARGAAAAAAAPGKKKARRTRSKAGTSASKKAADDADAADDDDEADTAAASAPKAAAQRESVTKDAVKDAAKDADDKAEADAPQRKKRRSRRRPSTKAAEPEPEPEPAEEPEPELADNEPPSDDDEDRDDDRPAEVVPSRSAARHTTRGATRVTVAAKASPKAAPKEPQEEDEDEDEDLRDPEDHDGAERDEAPRDADSESAESTTQAERKRRRRGSRGGRRRKGQKAEPDREAAERDEVAVAPKSRAASRPDAGPRERSRGGSSRGDSSRGDSSRGDSSRGDSSRVGSSRGDSSRGDSPSSVRRVASRTSGAATVESIPGEDEDDLPVLAGQKGSAGQKGGPPSGELDAESDRAGKKRRRRRKRRGAEGDAPRERGTAARDDQRDEDDDDADELDSDEDGHTAVESPPEESAERASKRGRRGRKKSGAKRPADGKDSGSGEKTPGKSAEELAEEEAAKAEKLRTQEILVNAVEPEEKRVAVLQGDLIIDLLMTAESQKTLVNDVYRGKVVNLEPAIGAAFIDFGQGRNGFLHTSDVLPNYGDDDFELEHLLTARVDIEEWGEDERIDVRDLVDEEDRDARDGAAELAPELSDDFHDLDVEEAHADGGDDGAAEARDEEHGDDEHDEAGGDSHGDDSGAAEADSERPGPPRSAAGGRGNPRRGGAARGQQGREVRAKGRMAERRKGRDRRPITDLLRVGDPVVVQITKDAIGDKGPTLTTYISIPGRYLVLMPSMSRTGVSRKIPDEKERRRLKKILAGMNVPADMGVIVRTAGIGKKKEDLTRDLNYLLGVWEGFGRKLRGSRGPSPLYQESDVATRTMRDLFNQHTKRVVVDDYTVHEQMCEFAGKLMPEHVNRIELYDGERPIFHQFGIEQDFERIFARRVELPSGGSVVFDQAEALVAIDVNSGRTRTDSFDFEKIALKTNLEAVTEIARQIRLRDLGGIIVCDFIDMMKPSSNRQVERALRDALETDRARSKLGRISQFGLLEMTRQRLGPGTHKKVFQACPRCRGTGRVRTLESRAQAILRRLGSALTQKGFTTVEVKAHPEVVKYLKDRLYDYIRAMEHRTEREIRLVASPDQTEDSVLNYMRADGREVRPGGRRKR